MRRHNDILIITHRLLCLFPGENRLFGSLAEYDAVAPLPPEPTPLAARIMARMTEIWALRTDARREVAHMLTFAFDAHVRALLHARSGGTEAGMRKLELEPYGRRCRVYSDLSLPANTAEAVAHGWRLKSVLKRWVSADEHHDASTPRHHELAGGFGTDLVPRQSIGRHDGHFPGSRFGRSRHPFASASPGNSHFFGSQRSFRLCQ